MVLLIIFYKNRLPNMSGLRSMKSQMPGFSSFLFSLSLLPVQAFVSKLEREDDPADRKSEVLRRVASCGHQRATAQLVTSFTETYC